MGSIITPNSVRVDDCTLETPTKPQSTKCHVLTRDRVGGGQNCNSQWKASIFWWAKILGLSLLKFSAFIWGRTDFPRICEELVLGTSEKLPNILAPLFTLIKYHLLRNYELVSPKARKAEKPKSRCEGDVCRDIGTRSQPEKPIPAM
jgi:hypothetical protein